MTTPVLCYPNFDLPFVIDTDACDVGVGVVLLQEEHPIFFYSKKLFPLRQRIFTYAKELWAITDAVHKWHHYLLDHDITIRMDHQSLKNLLNQTIQTHEQQFFLTKLLGFQYTIVYKKGKDNGAAYALSRLPDIEQEAPAVMTVLVAVEQPEWVNQLQKENLARPWLIKMQEQVKRGEVWKESHITNGILFFNNCYVHIGSRFFAPHFNHTRVA